ncbi:hypothetical protein [Fulvimarina pelagi]|uniref:hypothetical protein n=1 Tax=Fulvimarina pelagi TaxID=217511 RepID=UPI00031864AD|nr:hypothetical protein [Fulvimarina pelagi]
MAITFATLMRRIRRELPFHFAVVRCRRVKLAGLSDHIRRDVGLPERGHYYRPLAADLHHHDQR